MAFTSSISPGSFARRSRRSGTSFYQSDNAHPELEEIYVIQKVRMPDGRIPKYPLHFTFMKNKNIPCKQLGHKFMVTGIQEKHILTNEGLKKCSEHCQGANQQICSPGEHWTYKGHCSRCSIPIRFDDSCVK